MVNKVTGTSVEFTVGKRGRVTPFTIVSAAAKEVVAKEKVKDKEFDPHFHLIKGKYLQMASSAGDDMHFFAWEKK